MFTWGAFASRLVTFVMTAAVIYFLVVLPTRALVQRRARGEGHGPVQPTQVELLTEIRDLPRAPQNGPVQGAAGPPAGPREPANGAG